MCFFILSCYYSVKKTEVLFKPGNTEAISMPLFVFLNQHLLLLYSGILPMNLKANYFILPITPSLLSSVSNIAKK